MLPRCSLPTATGLLGCCPFYGSPGMFDVFSARYRLGEEVEATAVLFPGHPRVVEMEAQVAHFISSPVFDHQSKCVGLHHLVDRTTYYYRPQLITIFKSSKT